MSQYASENHLESEGLLHIARSWDEKCALKVRKIRLLQSFDLPLDETCVFPIGCLNNECTFYPPPRTAFNHDATQHGVSIEDMGASPKVVISWAEVYMVFC